MKKILMLFGVIGWAFSVSCGDENPLDAAWAKFEDAKGTDDYTEAYTAFSDLVSSEGTPAMVGLGWTVLRMDSMAAADMYFSQVASDSVVDAYAGWEFAQWALGNYTGSIAKGDFVLRKEPRYVFEHDRTVTDEDVKLHQAYGYFHTGNYSQCIAKIQAIDPGYIPPSLSDPQLEEKLLIKLESLRSTAG